jgi:hypothetical protein
VIKIQNSKMENPAFVAISRKSLNKNPESKIVEIFSNQPRAEEPISHGKLALRFSLNYKILMKKVLIKERIHQNKKK